MTATEKKGNENQAEMKHREASRLNYLPVKASEIIKKTKVNISVTPNIYLSNMCFETVNLVMFFISSLLFSL